MDFYGFIAFCIGLGWIPVALVVTGVYMIIEHIRRKNE